MRRGLRLIALSALGALAIPASSQAVQAEAGADLVKQVLLEARVKHLATGKVGTFKLDFQQRQGVSFVKKPIGSNLDDYDLDPHIGEGVPSGGLPNYVGCMTLVIKDVVNHQRRCVIFGNSASLEADPAMSKVALSATMGPDDEYKTSFSLNIKASSDPAQESVERKTEVRPTTRDGGGYLVDSAEGAKRAGVLVGGILFDETPKVNSITFVPTTEKVTVRQFVDVHSALIRRPLVCSQGDGSGIVVGALGQTVDVYSADNDDPDSLPQPGPDGKPDYIQVPPGCHPDDTLPPVVPLP